jgi:uncharacterized protein
VSVRLFDAVAAISQKLPSPFCVLGDYCSSHMVVEASGDVYPCDFFVVPEWHLGNVLTDELADLASSEARERFARAKRRRIRRCSRCRWVRYCHGGCLKDRSRFGGSFDRVSWLCEGYRMFFAKALSPEA